MGFAYGLFMCLWPGPRLAVATIEKTCRLREDEEKQCMKGKMMMNEEDDDDDDNRIFLGFLLSANRGVFATSCDAVNLFCDVVWIYIRPLENIEAVNPTLHDILSHLQPMAKYWTANSIIGKLLLAATSYYIWIEHNNRLFKNVKRAPEELRDIIMVTVRLKLMTFRFKNTTTVTHMLELWKMPESFRLYGC
nr:reverse transcriptase domain, reverse transcriptase zinc-binding domain protein [Tanacetum cinerariifolium]